MGCFRLHLSLLYKIHFWRLCAGPDFSAILKRMQRIFVVKVSFALPRPPPQHCALKHCRLVIYACALRAKSRSVLNTVCAGPHLQKIGGFAHAYLGTSDTVN